MSRYRVLIVDDDAFVSEDISLALNADQFEIDTAQRSDQAFELFKQKQHQIVLTDLHMENPDAGFQLLDNIKKVSADTAVMIITGFSDVQRAVRAMQLGAVDYVTKPLDTEQIVIKVEKIAEQVALRNENAHLRSELFSHYEIIGNSPAIQALKKQIAIVATKSDSSSVLIAGPNGSGKELVAWAIKNQSSRANKPFEIVNCAALPETLIESELFGTVRGAFTNATGKKGKFELADGGTIFLDEIGDMSLATQAKVLRVLQSGEFSRIGGEKSTKADFRVISATNKNLQEMIRLKQFREDLYYRLNVVPITTTSLKDRSEDIPLLIEHKLKKMGKSAEVFTMFDSSVIDYFKSLEWPGNVRELHNVIERLMIYWNGEPINFDYVRQYVSGPSRTAQAAECTQSLKDATNEFEKGYIQRVLDECKGTMSEAAKRLGLERPYLYEKMKKLGVERTARTEKEPIGCSPPLS